jgi:hypothetical protein
MKTYIGTRLARYVLRRVLLSSAVILGTPVPSAAWTETRVVAASARVDARSGSRASVQLELGVHVHSGWLSRFELLDLGPELQLDPRHEVRFVDAQGKLYKPTVHALDARGAVLEFPDRSHAPKPGDYTLVLAWTSQLNGAPDAAHRTWTLPRWPNRIPNAQIELIAPSGTQPVTSESSHSDLLTVQELTEQHATLVRFVRAELPRTEGFTVSWAVTQAQKQRARAPLVPTLLARAGQYERLRLGLGASLLLGCLIYAAGALYGFLRTRRRQRPSDTVMPRTSR